VERVDWNGGISSPGQEIRMKKRVWLTMALGAVLAGTAYGQAAKDLSGNWQGTLEAGNGLRTLLKITNNDGKYKAVMYSIDQGGQAIAVNTISIQGNAVTFAITGLDMKYAGTLNPDGNTISGSATQHGETHALNLTAGERRERLGDSGATQTHGEGCEAGL
jgi:hypothetical protein